MSYLFQKPAISLKKWKYPVALFIFLLIAYLPLSSFQFALKNDAFIYNFPNKHFFSEVLRNGHIPFWNPYLNYGFPLYADPGFGWWHPITWLFGIIGYNPYSFTIEVLVYLYISGISMYWLARKWAMENTTAFIMGCMYMCSGFFIGNLQHINFITCSAFLPLVIGTWLNLQNTPSFKNVLLAAIAAYLLCTAGHPAIPVATVYFMLTVIIMYAIYFRKKINTASFFKWNAGYMLITFILLAPALYSWFSLMPYYARGEPVNQQGALHLGFTVPSFLSFIAPFSTIKNPGFFLTDVSMRNAYFSLCGICLLIIGFTRKKNIFQKIFLFTGILFLFLSFGGFIKELMFNNLPLLNFIRANGQYRVFAIFSFIIISGYFLNNLDAIPGLKMTLQKAFKYLFFLLLAAMIVLGFLVLKENVSLKETGTDASFLIKNLLEGLTFYQSMFIGVLEATLLAGLYYISLKRKSWRFFYFIILFDLMINSWLLLPITGVGKTSVATMHSIIEKSPDVFTMPSLKFYKEKIPVTAEEEKLIGNWGWYSRKISHNKMIDYPSSLISTERYFSSVDTVNILNKPDVFTVNTNASTNIKINAFTANSINLEIDAKENDTLVFLQTKFPGWSAMSNGKPATILNYAGNFIAIPVNKETQSVMLNFHPFK